MTNQEPKTLREARKTIRMTLKQLAKKTGKGVSTLSELEDREKDGQVTIKNLSEVADSMGFSLEYRFVYQGDLQTELTKQAKKQMLSELKQHGIHSDELSEDAVRNEIAEILKDKFLKWD